MTVADFTGPPSAQPGTPARLIEPTWLEVGRAATWLTARGAPVSIPNWLLTARLSPRLVRSVDQKASQQVLNLLCSVALMAGMVLLSTLNTEWATRVQGAGAALGGALAVLLPWARWYAFSRMEQELAKVLPRRAASTSARSIPQILGGWFLVTLTVTFPGGLALGIVLTMRSSDGDQLRTSLLFTGAVVLCALIYGSILIRTLRRPALAEDAASLAVDDLLRTEDIHRYVSPWVAALGGLLVFNSQIATPLRLAAGAYVALSLVPYAAALIQDRYFRKLPSPDQLAAVTSSSSTKDRKAAS
ncbi:hypothetical protein SAMN05421504_106542 [Amycolatopsis xylanica]|uniref:Uncharacterized protein n=1 Tax=Amycolatopsis xylanica TaxID=589385 RepID=A0A1H3M914_9PSEU|nr:hypothetical protein [Amycolatopsis xylanica]SDY73093.1 hypothetical protein SAMN05421504_106542 [Amycolatopsis xylanica]